MNPFAFCRAFPHPKWWVDMQYVCTTRVPGPVLPLGTDPGDTQALDRTRQGNATGSPRSPGFNFSPPTRSHG
jgi:hypothetical protein